MFTTRTIASKFIAKEQSEGVGAVVRRSVGSFHLRNLDPFLMLDEFRGGLPAGFPDHPHRGFETVGYVLPDSKGWMVHEDHLGNKGNLGPGDLQWMTAGRGIVHGELPATTDEVHGLQLWVNLPKAKKMMEPRYQEVKSKRVAHSFSEDGKVEALVFAGEAFGVKGPVETVAPVTYVHFIMQRGATVEYRIPEGHNAFVYVLSGKGTIVDQSAGKHEAVVLEMDGDGITIASDNDDDFQFLVLSGKPLNEPVLQHGPFVMTTNEEIRETIMDYQVGRNGFENAPNWQSSISRR